MLKRESIHEEWYSMDREIHDWKVSVEVVRLAFAHIVVTMAMHCSAAEIRNWSFTLLWRVMFLFYDSTVEQDILTPILEWDILP